VVDQTSAIGAVHPWGLILTKVVDGTAKFGSGLALIPYFTGMPLSGAAPAPIYKVPLVNALAPQVFSLTPTGIAVPAGPGTPPALGSYMLTGSLGGLTSSRFAIAA
jgi:hypothetical protein